MVEGPLGHEHSHSHNHERDQVDPSSVIVSSSPSSISRRLASEDAVVVTEQKEAHFATEKYMGAALALGFAVMFLIDQFGPSHSHKPSSAGILDAEEPGKSYKSAFLGKFQKRFFLFKTLAACQIWRDEGEGGR